MAKNIFMHFQISKYIFLCVFISQDYVVVDDTTVNLGLSDTAGIFGLCR
jgi:hypothetical protein